MFFFHPQLCDRHYRRACQRPSLQLATVAFLAAIPIRQIIFSNVSRSNKANNPLHCDKNYLHESKVLWSIQVAFLLSSLYLILLSLNLMFVLPHAFLIKFSVPRNSAAFSCCLPSINLIFLGVHCTLSPCPLSHVYLHCNCPGVVFLYVPVTVGLQS